MWDYFFMDVMDFIRVVIKGFILKVMIYIDMIILRIII